MIKTLLFYIPIVVDIIGILVAFYFLIADKMRYSSSKNGQLLLVTFLMCGWVALCFYLRTTTSGSLGTKLAWIPATPLLLYGIFILMFMILKPNMR